MSNNAVATTMMALNNTAQSTPGTFFPGGLSRNKIMMPVGGYKHAPLGLQTQSLHQYSLDCECLPQQ